MPRFAAVDVHYPDTGGATAALVMAAEPVFAVLVAELTVHQDEVLPYRPGAFYERELPPLLAAVRAAPGLPDLLVVDGYVTLDPQGRRGLGAHVHHELGIPVIGVAKSAFRGAQHAIAVYRGTSLKPLHVTAAGMADADAAALVRAMAGPHRMPTALTRVDALSRHPTG